jgi:hypothetical protein
VDFSYIEHDAGKCFSNDIYFWIVLDVASE